ncbi:type III restriction system methyltransferase [Alistipes sp. CAG:435]|jgi:adenine-specific DNA-methyltransferase|nr:type III restriction system methyltransferase [Alistipes sp. CAG:435]
MDRLKMHTQDIVDVNVGKIGKLFPNCLTERVGENGRLEHAIDFDKLRVELSKDIVEGTQERYQFTWPGKREAMRIANTPSNMTLRPDRESSVDFDNTGNLYIEGDNLEVLKLLREDYLGKVKMIYIDPPYNTGNDFVYEDDFSQTAGEFRDKSGMFDEDGNMILQNYEVNSESNGRFHTDWLNMIYPRLKVARDLLTEDGVIFISIDDNEVENLRKVCDEVFGERNFIAQLIWERAFSPKNDARFVSNSHDYVLMFTRNIDSFVIGRLDRTAEANARYSNPDNDPRGVWMSSDISVKTYNAACDYPITTPSGKIIEPPAGRCWSLSKKAFFERLQDNRIWFGPNGDNTPRIKRFLSELKFDGMAPTSILFYKDVGHSQEGAQEVVSLFGDKGVFDGPKPVRLLQRLITLANLKDDSIVLDFFSGSATTAHALMKTNLEKGTDRKFILVQLPEKVSDKKKDQGYGTICEIGKERIRRAGKKILEELATKKAENGLFDKESEPTRLDVGFRVLKLDTSNMQDVYYTPEDSSAATLFDDNVKPDRTPEDLLFQVMLEYNLPLSAKIERKTIAGKEVFSVNDDYLIACFDENVNETVITEVAKRKPLYFIMRDSSLSSDQVADNFEQIFNAYSKDTIRRIL